MYGLRCKEPTLLYGRQISNWLLMNSESVKPSVRDTCLGVTEAHAEMGQNSTKEIQGSFLKEKKPESIKFHGSQTNGNTS